MITLSKNSKTELDKIPSAELLDYPEDTEILGFGRDKAKGMWTQAVEYWSEDGGWFYQIAMNGFKGWAERTDFEIYCDLRFTYIDGQDYTWDQFWDDANELGKYS